MSQLRRVATVLAASTVLASTAEAGTYSLRSLGPTSDLTFTSISGARTVVAAPTSCDGTVSPSWPAGTFSRTTCADEPSAVTADGRAATAHVSVASGFGSFGPRDVLSFRPTMTLRIAANDGSFDCTATTNNGLPDFSAVMSPTLPLPPPSYVGRLALVASVTPGGFAVTPSCSAGVARSLDAQFDALTGGTFDATYGP